MKFIKILYFSFCFMFLFSTSTLAYVDPATTTYVIQIVAGVFIAGGVAMGVYWHKIKRFFKKLMKKDKNKK